MIAGIFFELLRRKGMIAMAFLAPYAGSKGRVVGGGVSGLTGDRCPRIEAAGPRRGVVWTFTKHWRGEGGEGLGAELVVDARDI